MRMHIELDADLSARLDEIAGPRGRSAFVRAAIERAIEQELRRQQLRSAAGTISEQGHDWDVDPAAWVREQRHADSARAG